MQSRSGFQRVFVSLSSALLLTSIAVGGCLGEPPASPGQDRRAPSLVQVEPDLSSAISPTPTLRLTFDEPVSGSALEQLIALLPYERGGPCTVDLSCGGGRCEAGRCQRDPVDQGWLSDLRNPPLSARRLEQAIPLDVRLADQGQTVVLAPLRPLEPRARHVLLLSPQLMDAAGNVIGSEVVQLRFVTAGEEQARPVLRLISPVEGATEQPTNLARVIVRSSQPLSGATGEGLFWLEADDGQRVPLWSSAADDVCPVQTGSPRCLRLRLIRALAPLRAWTLRVSSRVTNGAGEPVFASDLRFASGAKADHRAPGVLQATLRISDGCALIVLSSDEPSDLSWRGSWTVTPASSVGRRIHQVGAALPATVDGTLWVDIVDLAGNRAVTRSFAVHHEGAPQVEISEVLANPRGPEPAQELVELHNRSAEAVSLDGWQLDDGDDGVGVNVLPAVSLPPGQRAVVVGPRYDLLSSADPPLAAGALLIRLDKTVGALGLSNGGEALALRDAQGRLVSTYGGFFAFDSKQLEGQSAQRVSGRCDLPQSWHIAPPSPGAAAAVEH
jgi:hypothetical protein